MSGTEEWYANPKHLIDLNLNQFDIIRNEFEKYEIDARNQNKYNDGIPLEVGLMHTRTHSFSSKNSLSRSRTNLTANSAAQVQGSAAHLSAT